jgi:hypothetical protein
MIEAKAEDNPAPTAAIPLYRICVILGREKIPQRVGKSPASVPYSTGLSHVVPCSFLLWAREDGNTLEYNPGGL